MSTTIARSFPDASVQDDMFSTVVKGLTLSSTARNFYRAMFGSVMDELSRAIDDHPAELRVEQTSDKGEELEIYLMDSEDSDAQIPDRETYILDVVRGAIHEFGGMIGDRASLDPGLSKDDATRILLRVVVLMKMTTFHHSHLRDYLDGQFPQYTYLPPLHNDADSFGRLSVESRAATYLKLHPEFSD